MPDQLLFSAPGLLIFLISLCSREKADRDAFILREVSGHRDRDMRLLSYTGVFLLLLISFTASYTNTLYYTHTNRYSYEGLCGMKRLAECVVVSAAAWRVCLHSEPRPQNSPWFSGAGWINHITTACVQCILFAMYRQLSLDYLKTKENVKMWSFSGEFWTHK